MLTVSIFVMRPSVRLIRLMFKLIPLVVVASLIVLGFFSATLTLLDYSPVAPAISAPVTPKSIAVTEATTLPQLPHFVREEKFADDWDGEYLLQWGSIEGLNARASGAKPIVKYHPTLTLVPVPTEGMHRLGIQVEGLSTGLIFQVGVWLKAVPNTKIGLNAFDANAVTNGTSTFDLDGGAVLSSVGAVHKSGVIVRPDHWYKPWLQMRSSNGLLFIDIQLLNADGASTYKGDGTQVVVFGGLEIMPTTEQ